MADHHHDFPPDDLDPSYPPRSILILYATESGTSQDAAVRVSRYCRRLQFHTRVVNIEAYPVEDLISEPLVLFLVSTTGAGKEPRSMTPLWTTLLRSDLPTDLFEDLNFAVFGLGDTSYEKFCWPAKLLERRLESLGGQVICERGEGDEQHRIGIDGALLPWMRQLESVLKELYPLPDNYEEERYPAEHELPHPRVAFSNPLGPVQDVEALVEKGFLKANGHHLATVIINKRITAPEWEQDVRHFELEFEGDVRYSPGDVAIIYPQAAPEDVDSFLTSNGWANIADELLAVEPMTSYHLPMHMSPHVTLRIIFTRYLDFGAVPRRSFFELIRHFASDDTEREKLTEFCQESGDGADDMYDYCTGMRRTIREVLDDFHSVRIPREYIFDVFPPMRARQFSIASSVKAHPRQVHLCVAIVRYRTKLKLTRQGVCTSHMARWEPGDRIIIGIQKGLMRLPPRPDIPIICVGPGTGVAPMRALIQERVIEGSTDNTLYFGCRSEKMDQHYANEWTTLASNNNLQYRLAPSRDGPEGVARVYVQHLIEQDADRVRRLLTEHGAWVYISGSSNKMPLAVKAALKATVCHDGQKTEEQAEELLVRMERDGRLLEECWS